MTNDKKEKKDVSKFGKTTSTVHEPKIPKKDKKKD